MISSSSERVQSSNRILHDDLARVFQDIDELKKSGQTADQERQIMNREINRLEKEKLADLRNEMNENERRFEAIEHFQVKPLLVSNILLY